MTLRIISFWVYLFLFLTITSCRKKIIQSLKEEEATEGPAQTPVIPPPPDPEPTPDQGKSLFKIGQDLGVRSSGASGCKDEICNTGDAFGLEGLNIPIAPGLSEGIILEHISLQNNVLSIKKSLEKLLTEFILELIRNERAILGIPLILNSPDENMQDLSFKIEAMGITPAMQIGVYTGPNTNKRIRITEKDGLKGFTRTTILISKPMLKPKEGTYYLLLHLSFQEVKELYDKLSQGAEVNFKITGTAKGYPEDIEAIRIRLE